MSDAFIDEVLGADIAAVVDDSRNALRHVFGNALRARERLINTDARERPGAGKIEPIRARVNAAIIEFPVFVRRGHVSESDRHIFEGIKRVSFGDDIFTNDCFAPESDGKKMQCSAQESVADRDEIGVKQGKRIHDLWVPETRVAFQKKDAVFFKKFSAECFTGFNAREFVRRTYTGNIKRQKRIHDSLRKRLFRSDDRKIGLNPLGKFHGMSYIFLLVLKVLE